MTRVGNHNRPRTLNLPSSLWFIHTLFLYLSLPLFLTLSLSRSSLHPLPLTLSLSLSLSHTQTYAAACIHPMTLEVVVVGNI